MNMESGPSGNQKEINKVQDNKERQNEYAEIIKQGVEIFRYKKRPSEDEIQREAYELAKKIRWDEQTPANKDFYDLGRRNSTKKIFDAFSEAARTGNTEQLKESLWQVWEPEDFKKLIDLLPTQKEKFNNEEHDKRIQSALQEIAYAKENDQEKYEWIRNQLIAYIDDMANYWPDDNEGEYGHTSNEPKGPYELEGLDESEHAELLEKLLEQENSGHKPSNDE